MYVPDFPHSKKIRLDPFGFIVLILRYISIDQPSLNLDPDILTLNEFKIQCTPDLVTSYLVTNPDLVTILQR